MSWVRPSLSLAVLSALTVWATACREAPEPPPPAAAALATVEPVEAAKPAPPQEPPRPTLTAVFVGDVAARLISAGAATAVPDVPPAAPAEAPSASGANAPAAAPTPAPVRAHVAAPVISREPHERPDDEPWTLPEPPAQLLWRHPAPAAGLQLELLEARGRSWPTRVRVEAVGDARLATLTALEPLPPGTSFRLVARVVAADGRSQLWTEPLKVKAPEAP